MMYPARWLRRGGLVGLSLVVPCAASGCGEGSRDDDSATSGVVTTVPTGDTGDDPTGDTGDDPTGGPPPGCDGVELAQDGVLDLDVPKAEYVVVSGQVLLNGGALPDAEGPRGQLRFDYSNSAGPPGSVTYALAATGAENYSVVLPAGSVSVHYVPDAALCGAHPEGPMPCSGGTVVAGATLADSGVLDLDIPAIVVAGAVTQDGEALPDADGDRGRIEFTGAAELAASASLAASGPGAYEIALFPGTYDVAFAGNAALCADGAAPVPCNRGVVQSGVTLAASGVLDVDVRRVEVAGAVTVNGAAIADGVADRGSLRFDPAGASDGGGLVVAPFGAAGPVSYAVSLVAGSYTIALVANPAQCSGEAPPTPCVGGPVLASLDLSSSGTLDVDIPLIEIGGAITLAGGALPDESGDRGAVVFGRDVADAATVALGAAGPKDYVLGLLPGQYAISYTANPGLCDGVTAPAMPCGGGPLQTLELKTSGVLDVDIPVVEISGQVTLAGGALPEQSVDRGSVVFAGAGGAALSVALGTGAFEGYAVTLMPGTYDVQYASAPECVGLPDDAMPCGGGRLAAGVSLASDGVLDVDIPAIEIGGLVTYAGKALPDLDMSRGALRWTRADGVAGGPMIGLETTGSLQYAVVVVPGRWIVDLAANPALCEDGVPAFPCTDRAIVGCE